MTTKKTVSNKANVSKTRPTKKQHETLDFIRHFIAEHGYSPSYREIMNGCNYTSVATVALHVNNLEKRGHIIKRNKSARSLEVVEQTTEQPQGKQHHKHEIMHEIERRFTALEAEISEELMNEVYVLVGALKVLGHHSEARAYALKISEIEAAG